MTEELKKLIKNFKYYDISGNYVNGASSILDILEYSRNSTSNKRVIRLSRVISRLEILCNKYKHINTVYEDFTSINDVATKLDITQTFINDNKKITDKSLNVIQLATSEVLNDMEAGREPKYLYQLYSYKLNILKKVFDILTQNVEQYDTIISEIGEII
jgi:hypothetical protein